MSDIKEVDISLDTIQNTNSKQIVTKQKYVTKYVYDSKLVGAHRRFDEKMYNKYDIPARNIIKEKLGEFVSDNPNIYGQDLIINSPTCKYKYLELQVCATWVNSSHCVYPYPNVWVYERKGVYNEDTLFLTLNKAMTCGYLFNAQSFKNNKPRRLKKYSREYVYDVPWSKVMKVYIEHLDQETIEAY